MNALIQQVLSKKASKGTKINLVTRTIAKPKLLLEDYCSITVDNSLVFYTFDGRALFFSKEQKEPIISLPDETKKVIFLTIDKESYAFILTSKNKLECCSYTGMLEDDRYIVTRNVIDVIKANQRIFYLFKKDKNYFINECVYNGKKFTGHCVLSGIEGTNVKIFPTDQAFYYIVDSKIYDCNGNWTGISGDFAYSYSDLMVVGSQKSKHYQIKLLDIKKSYALIDSFNLECLNLFNVVSHDNFLIFQQNINNLNIFKINPDKSQFEIKYLSKYAYSIFSYDFEVSNGFINLYILTDSKHFDSLDVITVSNIESFISKSQPLSPTIDFTKSHSILNSEDSIKSDPGFFCENFSLKKSSILKEMESMSLAPSNNSEISEQKPKNNLLEEVRAKLSKAKQLSNEETIKPHPDRFEVFKLLNTEPKFGSDVQSIKREGFTKSRPDLIPNDSKIQTKQEVGYSSQTETFDSSKVEMNDFVKSNEMIKMTDLARSIKNIEKSIGDLTKEISLKSFNDEKYKNIVKNTVIEVLVPCVEACFNEMKIQMQVEIKKMINMNLKTGESSRLALIKKYLSNEKPAQAIEEFLKLEEKEIISNLSIFTPLSIENAESNALASLLLKVYSVLQKAPKKACFDLIYICLIDIDIEDLSVENLQEISVVLRTIKDMESFDKDKNLDLNCVIDIVSKKIKKRAKRDVSK